MIRHSNSIAGHLLPGLVRWSVGFCASLGLALAQIPGDFQQIDGDGGGWFTGFAGHGSGRVYGRTDVGGLYRSDDHGDHWTFLSGSMTTAAAHCVQGIAVAANDPDVVYQAVGVSYSAGDPARGIWKSTDGGTNWTQVKSALAFSGNDSERWGGECLALMPGNDSEVWAGSRAQGLWRSSNAGGAWSQVGGATFNGVNFTSLCLRPTAANDLWVAGTGGVWVTTTGGASWTKVRTMDVAWQISRKSDGTVFISGNEGGGRRLWRVTATNWADSSTYTWTNVWTNWLAAHQTQFGWQPGDENPQVTVLSDGRVVASALFQATAISTTNGTSWTFPAMTPLSPQPVWEHVPAPTRLTGGRNRLVEDPSDPNRWFLAGGYSPLRSTDQGATWRHITAGVGEIVTFKTTFHPTDPSRVFIPMADHAGGVITDGGASGTITGFAGKHFPWPDDTITMGHVILPNSGSRLLIPGNEMGGQQARLYYSEDNGATWSKRPFTGLPSGGGRPIVAAVASRDDADDFLVVVGGAMGATEGGVYRTTNAGLTFTRATGLPVNGFAVGDQFYWNADIEADATDHGVRYLLLRGTGGGVFKSVNRGAAWSLLPVQPRRNFGRLAADAVRPGRLWAGFTTGETGVGLDVSSNGGTSWTPVTGFNEAQEIDAVDGRVAVLGRRTGDTYSKIYYSSDDGATWSEITRPGYRFGNASQVAVDPWRPGTVWISTGGRSTARFTPWTPIQHWRQLRFGSPADAGTGADAHDADDDGLTNLAEYALGTDPLDASSFRQPTANLVASPPALSVSIIRGAAQPEVTVGFESSTTLAGWTPLATESATATEVRALDTDHATAPRRFYRLKVTRP